MIYLDHCATTPPHPEVRAAMEEVSARIARSEVSNPSSVHRSGRAARAILNDARARTAGLLGVSPGEVTFTSSATEANNMVLKGFALAHLGRAARIVISAVEHDSVVRPARYLAARIPGLTLVEVPPDGEGAVRPDDFARALSGGEPALVCIMAVNNETGAIQPVEEILAAARPLGALLHCDAAHVPARTGIGGLPGEVDFFALSGHKCSGPAGAALLTSRSGLRPDSAPDPLLHGGNQEGGRRAGTENLPAVVGLTRALELAGSGIAENRQRLSDMDHAMTNRLKELGTRFTLNGPSTRRAPGILNLSFDGAGGDDLVIGMDLAGFAISTGSACSSGVMEPSRVLQAMGLPDKQVRSSVRISFGVDNTDADAVAAADAMAGLAARLRGDGSTIGGEGAL